MAQLVERPTLDFSSGHDPRVVGSSPTLDSTLSMEPSWDSFSLSLSSLSQKTNKQQQQQKTWQNHSWGKTGRGTKWLRKMFKENNNFINGMTLNKNTNTNCVSAVYSLFVITG